MKKHVLIVGGIKAIHKKLRDMGHDISLIVSARNADGRDLKEGYRFVFVVPEGSPITTWVDLAHSIDRSEHVSHIAGFHDDDQDKAIAISEGLNLPFWLNKSVLDYTRDKGLMRERLSDCGLNEVESRVAKNAEELHNVLSVFRTPMIVKPVSGSASQGVNAIKNSDESLAFLSNQSAQSIEYPVVVEEYMEGNEFSVEGFSCGGTHRFWGITRKCKFDDSFVESGHEFPANLPVDLRERIFSYVGACLNALGVSNGASHTEIILTAEGNIQIVETHTRLGGDRIVDLIRLVTNEDPHVISAQAATGELSDDFFKSKVQYRGTAAISFLAAQQHDSGQLGMVSGIDTARSTSLVQEVTLLKNVGDQLVPLATSFDRLALALAYDEKGQSAMKACLTALSQLVFMHQLPLLIR
jgi:biotin carboxylase